MAGSSRRRGAVRKAGSKKGPSVGTGGHRRKALQGKGPTPKATERAGHPAARRTPPGDAGKRRPVAGEGPARSGADGAPSGSGARARGGAGGSEVIGGRNAVVEALRAGAPVSALYVAVGIESDERVTEALHSAADGKIPLLHASRADLDRLTGGAVHQGLAVQLPAYRYAHPMDLLEPATDSGRPPLLVALDSVTDPRNLGAVVRAVGAFGGHGVVIQERRAAGVTATAWKASAGALARVPVARSTNLTRALVDYQRAGLLVVGLDGGARTTLAEVDVADRPLVLVVGAEGAGLSRLVRQTCDVVVSIPMAGSMESLNVSVAAGIALYEVAGRR